MNGYRIERFFSCSLWLKVAAGLPDKPIFALSQGKIIAGPPSIAG
jgi:hypothetical protein